MPNLTNVYLAEEAFEYKSDVTIRGSTHFMHLSPIGIGALANHKNLPKHNPKANVCDVGDLNSLNSTVSSIVTNNGSLNGSSFTVLDLTRFKFLKRIVIGDGCCKSVKELVFSGLHGLESIMIGEISCCSASLELKSNEEENE